MLVSNLQYHINQQYYNNVALNYDLFINTLMARGKCKRLQFIAAVVLRVTAHTNVLPEYLLCTRCTKKCTQIFFLEFSLIWHGSVEV